MNQYRTHYCSDLSSKNLNEKVILSGWIDTKRDHGNLLFIDLRDNYGITQCVIDIKLWLHKRIFRLLLKQWLIKWNKFSSLRFLKKSSKKIFFLDWRK